MANKNIDVSAARTFITVAELGQLTKAARFLNITQSAASQQVQRLESMLGVELFHRTANRVKLSDCGKIVYRKLKKLIELNDDILSDIWSVNRPQSIRLGVPHDLVERVMPVVLKRFSAANPFVEVKLASMSSGNLRVLLEGGELDLTLTTELAGRQIGEKLFEDRLIWAGAKGGQAYALSPLIVALGDETDQFAGPARKALDQSRLTWKSMRQDGGLGSVLAMLAADIAVAPFLASALPDTLSEIEDPRLPALPRYEIDLLAHAGRVTIEQEALISAIRDYFNELEPPSFPVEGGR